MIPIDPSPLPIDMILGAYAQGYFPMADSADKPEIHWYNPPQRAVLPIRDLHISRSLRKTLARHPYEIRIDTAFERVVEACAMPTDQRPRTWINPDIVAIFMALHHAGFAHSVECWTKDGELAGGLYGLALNGAFCGESMFSIQPDASKIVLVHLCARLDKAGFMLLDSQIINPHIERFGASIIPKAEYLARLNSALNIPPDFSLSTYHPVNEEKLVSDYLLLRKY